MFRNYLKVALRNLHKSKGFSFINIVGLALGIAACLLIALFVLDELSYDRYHEKADRIYRVGSEIAFGGEVHRTARTPHPLAPALVREFPEVEAAVRFRRSETVIRRNEEIFKEERFYYADASVFDLFSFSLVEGDSATALSDRFSVVIARETARKYFGGENPLGKVLEAVGVGDLRVTGVLQEIPHNSHFTFDFLASYETLRATQGSRLEAWDNFVTSTYLLLPVEYDPSVLETKLGRMVSRYLGEEGAWAANKFFLDPLTSLHLRSHLEGELGERSDVRYIYIFSSIATFVLLLACINFVCLSTARAADRAREVGMRKVLGAGRGQLLRQFLGESLLLVVMAFVLALGLVELALPAFGDVTQKALSLPYNPMLITGLICACLGIALFAGAYPALVLSAFRPANAVKGRVRRTSSAPSLRKGFVTFQFVISILFVSAAIVITNQMNYIQNKDLGFEKDRVVVVPLPDPSLRSRYESIKTELSKNPNVVSASACYHTPGHGLGEYRVEIQGVNRPLSVPTYIVDYDFISTFEMEIVRGRSFSRSLATDARHAFIVNEEAVEEFGWKEPIGQKIIWDGEKSGNVIGVVKDFHFESLHKKIRPMVIHIDPDYFTRLAVRLRPTDMPGTISFLKETMQKMDPNHPFEFSFVDDDFARQYRAERRTAKLVTYATALAIVVASMGLLGLASLTTSLRTKEIGVRKVLGASSSSIVLLLARDLVKVVAIAAVVSTPLSYVVMNRWLQSFAYRVEVGPGTILAATVIALMTALLTVSFQSFKAALADPVDTLRYE